MLNLLSLGLIFALPGLNDIAYKVSDTYIYRIVHEFLHEWVEAFFSVDHAQKLDNDRVPIRNKHGDMLDVDMLNRTARRTGRGAERFIRSDWSVPGNSRTRSSGRHSTWGKR